jgi:ABC-type metal ion transport system substrate-binding protein
MKTKRMPQVAIALAFVFTLALWGCGKDSGTGKLRVLKIGASPTPHTEILKSIVPKLKERGIDLQIKEFTDYVLPNTALENKELDANYFQHVPYLEDFNKKNNTHLSAAIPVHFEPLGLYPGKTKSLRSFVAITSLSILMSSLFSSPLRTTMTFAKVFAARESLLSEARASFDALNLASIA